MQKRYIDAIIAWMRQLDIVNAIRLSDTHEGLDNANYKLAILEQEKIVAERVLLQSCRDAAFSAVNE